MIGLTTTVSTSGLGLFQDILKLNPRSLNMAGAQSARVLVIDHLRAYDRANPNKLGGKRVHIAGQMADSTRAEATAEEGAVIIAHPFANFFIRGGTIRPGKGISFATGGPTRALTAAASAESYGERAEKFKGSSAAIYFKVPRGKLVGMIVTKDKFKKVLYWLLSEATIKGRPDAIPTEQQVMDAALGGMQKFIFRNTPSNA